MENLELKIILGFLLFILLILAAASIVVDNGKREACEAVGGELSGYSHCRKGNEFYSIYQSNKYDIFHFTVNKYPKTE